MSVLLTIRAFLLLSLFVCVTIAIVAAIAFRLVPGYLPARLVPGDLNAWGARIAFRLVFFVIAPLAILSLLIEMLK